MHRRLARLCHRWGLLSLALLLVSCPSPAAAQNKAAPPPTFEDVAYGPHERNRLDLWQAKSERPTPLVVFIHGGGFVNGDKSAVRRSPAVRQCLDAGVSFASLNYRFREHAPIQDILRDAARAMQYIRSRAKEWNIDPTRIASYGSSAGAGTSLWLAFHDDLADPENKDPVLRQSTRLAAAGSLDGQATYDFRQWAEIMGASEYERPEAERLQFYGFRTSAESETPQADKIMKDCSMINLISRGDPPVAVACSRPQGEPQDRGHYVHHPKHSIAIADRCKENGIECKLILNDQATGGRADQATAVVAFLIDKLKAPAP